MKFKLDGGLHAEGDEVYAKGDIVESSKDLVALFGKKFILVDDSPMVSTGPVTPNQENPLGEDVTANFASVPDGFLVFKSKGWYNVAAEDDPTVAVNQDKMRKAVVGEFLESLAVE